MLSISSGHSAAYLTGQVAQGRESYYLDAETAGEPPGRWWGTGAEAFGLTGEVDHEVMHHLFAEFADPRDPRFGQPECARLGNPPRKYRTAEEIFADRIAAEPDALPERVAQIRREADRAQRKPVAFLDATFSPAKSVTILHVAFSRAELDAQRAGDDAAAAQWAGKRRAVEEAIWAGNNAMLTYMADKAGYSRAGWHGTAAGRWVDGHDWTVASFFQHDSRDHDPALHVHNAVLNRVVCSDGQVRTLDGQALYGWKQGAGSLGEKVMEAALAASLGVRWSMRADGVAREVTGISDEVMALFSGRSTKISRKLAVELQAFRDHFGHEPNALQMDRLRRQATMATRKAKSHDAESHGERLDRWDDELRAEVAGGLYQVAESFLSPAEETLAEEWSPSGVIAEALAAAQAARSAFGPSEATRQITLALPDHLGIPADQVPELVDRLVATALQGREVVQVTGGNAPEVPAELRLADGRSMYLNPTGARYATRNHLAAERALRKAAVERGRHAVAEDEADRWLAEHGTELGEDQAAAVRGMLTSGAAVSVVIGPAGTGKSFTMGATARAWSDLTGGRLIGLATSQIATEVLADEGLAAAMNITRWLAAQDRLTAGRFAHADLRWRLTDRDAVVVDESSMVDTASLTEIRRLVDAAGARLILTGDPRQLAAVGASGAMEMVAADAVDKHTLAEARRFENDWERSASLRLRDGDVDVLDEYSRRGRLHDCGTPEAAGIAAARAYLGDVLGGRSSVVVTATNREAAAVSATVRDELVALGRVAEDGVVLGRDNNVAGVGDLVQARMNDHSIGVTNRRRYTVTEVREDGGLVVRTEDGDQSRTLPAGYVLEHVTLAYASTAHSAQGITTDTAHLVATTGTTPEGLYVGLSRGRQANTAHVATHPETPGAETGTTHERLRRSPAAVLADVISATDRAETAAVIQDADDAEAAAGMAQIHAWREDAVRIACSARTATALDQLAGDGVITDAQRAAFAADQGTEQLARLLRVAEQAGDDPEAVLREALEARTLAGSTSVAQVTQARITTAMGDRTAPLADHATDDAPAGLTGEWSAYFADLADRADTRRRELGTETAEARPQWAMEAFGPVPEDVVDRQEWEYAAGVVAAHREAVRWPDEAVPLGPAPGLSHTEARASWYAAWRALGRPESGQDEQHLGEGTLRVRVRAWDREQDWAPKWVDEEMRATGQAVARNRQDAAILAAQADAADDQDEADRLRQEAAGRAALADTLTSVEAKLSEAAVGRADWYIETAATRMAGERAKAELAARGRDIGAEDDRTTADEWLAAQDDAVRAEDPHRPVTEVDVRTEDEHQDERTDPADERTSQDEAGDERTDERTMPDGVPSPTETAAAVLLAQLAAQEIDDRRAAEAVHTQDEAGRTADEARASREQAWRDADRRAAEEAARERDDALAWQ